MKKSEYIQEQIPAIIDIAIVAARNMESNGITFDDTKPFQTAN